MRTAKYIRPDHPLTQALMIVQTARDRITAEVSSVGPIQVTEQLKHLDKVGRIYRYLTDQHKACPAAWWEVSL